jgi:multidrug efflux system membrane fusion protein
VLKRQATGQPMTVEAWDTAITTKLATGTVLAIDNQVDPTTGTFKIKAQFANENDLLFPNEFVNARLLVAVDKGVVIVPTAAVQRGPDSSYVYVVKSDNTVALQNVQTGATEGDDTVIKEGIAAGDVVVTDGVDKLQQGATVQPHEQKTATPPAGASTRPGQISATTGPSAGAATQPAGGHHHHDDAGSGDAHPSAPEGAP